MAVDWKDRRFLVRAVVVGEPRVRTGQVALEVLDGQALTVFLSVMERSEAVALARDLVLAAEDD